MDLNRRTLSTFRLHVLLASSITTLAFIAVIAFSLFIPLSTHLDSNALDAGASAGIASHFLYLHAAFWPVTMCAMVSCIVSALLLYKKMVGPLVQFVRCFDAIGRNEHPNPITIRRTDYLGVEVDALNRMIGDVRTRSEARTEALSELHAIADELAGNDSVSNDYDEIASRIRNLKGLE